MSMASHVSNIQAMVMMCVNVTTVNETAYWVSSAFYSGFKEKAYRIVGNYEGKSKPFVEGDDSWEERELDLINHAYSEVFDFAFEMQNALGNISHIIPNTGEAAKYYYNQAPYVTKVHNFILIMDYLCARNEIKHHRNSSSAWTWMNFAAHDVSKLWANAIAGWVLAIYSTGHVKSGLTREGDENDLNLQVHMEALMFPALHVLPGAKDNLDLAFNYFLVDGNQNGLTPSGYEMWQSMTNDLGRLYGIHSCVLMYYVKHFPRLFRTCDETCQHDPACYQMIPGPRFQDQPAYSGNLSDDPVLRSIRVPYAKPAGKYLYNRRHHVVDKTFAPIPAIKAYVEMFLANMSRVVPTTSAEQRWIAQARRKRGYHDPDFADSKRARCPFLGTAGTRESAQEYNKDILDILYNGAEASGRETWPLVCRFANEQPRSGWSTASLAVRENFQGLRNMKLNFNLSNLAAGEFWSGVFLHDSAVAARSSAPKPTGILYPPTSVPHTPASVSIFWSTFQRVSCSLRRGMGFASPTFENSPDQGSGPFYF